MRGRRQAEVDERERRRRIELAQERDGARARLAGMDLELGTEGEGERVGDERIVIHHQQAGARRGEGFRRRRHWTRHECTG